MMNKNFYKSLCIAMIVCHTSTHSMFPPQEPEHTSEMGRHPLTDNGELDLNNIERLLFYPMIIHPESLTENNARLALPYEEFLQPGTTIPAAALLVNRYPIIIKDENENPPQLRHIRRIYIPEENDSSMTSDEIFECSECSAIFRYHKALLRHQIQHSDARPFSCCNCAASFKYQYHLTAHMNTVHLKLTECKCSRCKKFFKRPSDRNRHEREVHDIHR